MKRMIKYAAAVGVAGVLALGMATPSQARHGRNAAAAIGFGAGALIGVAAANAATTATTVRAMATAEPGYAYAEPGYGYAEPGYGAYGYSPRGGNSNAVLRDPGRIWPGYGLRQLLLGAKLRRIGGGGP